MRYTTFRYNDETCQYERVGLNARSIIWYMLGLSVVGACMLVGILLLHDLLINTDRENYLRKENRALRKHHSVLSTEMSELQPVLASLQDKDKILHSKFFGSQPEVHIEGKDPALKQNMLLADGSIFRSKVSDLKGSSKTLIARSASSNRYFARELALKKDVAGRISFLPTLQPIQPWDAGRLISGFGMRVNPFHKGLYEHLGVDLAMPRGTPVVATATGTVVQLKQSDLQAGYGNYLDVDHGNGIVTRYAHLEDISVKYGARVVKGQTIGSVGTSGGSIAPHVHYEIIRDGKNVDPVHYMVEGITASEHHFLTIMSHKQNQSLD